MNLDIYASELATFIDENENLTLVKLNKIVNEYVENHWGNLCPNHKGYVINKAHEIYMKI